MSAARICVAVTYMSHSSTHAECRLVQSLEVFVLYFDSTLHGVLPGRGHYTETTGVLE